MSCLQSGIRSFGSVQYFVYKSQASIYYVAVMESGEDGEDEVVIWWRRDNGSGGTGSGRAWYDPCGYFVWRPGGWWSNLWRQ